MKKLTAFFGVIVMLAALCSCGGANEQNSAENVLSAYKTPSAVVKLDLSKDDPSVEEMVFAYNDDGSISACRYKADGHDVTTAYSYNDSQIHIYAFMDDIVTADELFTAKSGYDPDIGFTEYKGYYFKGFAF